MTMKLLKGALVGGLVYFAWGAASWMLLPGHEQAILKFTNEAEVSSVLKANAPNPGVYLLPNPHAGTEGLSPEAKDQAMAEAERKMKEGPFVFASVRTMGISREMGASMFLSLLAHCVTALLFTWILLKAGPASYMDRVKLFTVLGLAAGFAGHSSHWIWWEFSTAYTFVALADLVIGSFLAGLAVARVTR